MKPRFWSRWYFFRSKRYSRAARCATSFCTSSSATLFAVKGWWVVELLGGVALVTTLAFWALHRRCATESQTAATVATSCIVLLTAFSWLTGFSIGFFVFPVVLLLTASAVLVPTSGRAGPS